MTTWVSLAIAAQALSAVSIFVDRYLLTHGKGIGRPVAYAFYVSLLSGFVLVLLPFHVISAPSLIVLELSLAMAVSFISSLILLYSALKEGKASDVMPVVAAFSAIASFVLAFVFIDENLPTMFLLAVAFFVIGTFLISRFRFTIRSITYIIIAGLLFGLSAFLIKLIFMNTTFWDGFFWSRMANVFGAALLLAWPGNLKAIMHGTKQSSHGMKWLVVGNKSLAGIAGAMMFFAISLGSVSVVNAMSGLQFAFLLGFAYLFAENFPKVLKDEVAPQGLRHKLSGIILIMLGIAVLYLA